MVRLDAIPPTRQDSPQLNLELPEGVVLLPMNLESDEPPLETDLHREQIDLLIRLLKYWWRERDDFYISGNLTVYYSAKQTKKRDFRGPDVFIVLGTEKKDRRSWTIWEEGGKYPNVVIELLSNSTATVDRGTKKDLYQNIWRLPEYYWFHPETLEFAGFRLVNGQYEEITPTDMGRLPSQQLGLELGLYGQKLRWFTDNGDLVPFPEEAERQEKELAEQQVLQERQEKEQERQEKEQAETIALQERQARERLEEYLRSQGIDPHQLPN
ncbi:MAG: Uma2 family endonuclease [Thermosynechococcaceae cyanobacterium]